MIFLYYTTVCWKTDTSLHKGESAWYDDKVEKHGGVCESRPHPAQAGSMTGRGCTAVGGINFEIMYRVYVLKSEKQLRYYVGHRHDLDARLAAHNGGKVRSTKAYRPWIVVYSESCANKQEAYKREFQIKSYKGGEAFKKLVA